MAYRGFGGSGYVGNFATAGSLETLYPAAEHAGRNATVETAGLVNWYFSNGATWALVGSGGASGLTIYDEGVQQGVATSLDVVGGMGSISMVGSAATLSLPTPSSNYLGLRSWSSISSLAAANPDTYVFCTNFGVGGSMLYSNGVRWKPVNNRTVLKTLETVPTITGASELTFTGTPILIPAGMWQVGDCIGLEISMSKDAGVGTATCSLRLGTTGTTADTLMYGTATAFLATTARSVGSQQKFRRVANTTQKMGGASVLAGLAGAQSTSTYPAAVTIPSNMDTTDLYLSLSCILTIATTETVSLNQWEVSYHASTN